MDRSSIIFGNPIDKKTLKAANKTKTKFIKKFGDDSNKTYHLGLKEVPTLSFMGVENLALSDKPLKVPENAVVVGNIRMGFGHYRISMAIASCAKALGYKPLWFDLASFDATGSKVIAYQNHLYSVASKLSQKSHLFNHFIWEPLNCEGFRKLTYNAKDQKTAELFAPLYADLPKDIPFVATHAWPSQGAIHAGLTHVVNAIPDNWPMALHLSQGAIHAVQTPFAYAGYKRLNGFAKKPLLPMGDDDLIRVGHYVDHELVSNVEEDCKRRRARREKNKPMRILLSVGGAGAGEKQFLAIMRKLLPLTKTGKVSLFLNFGDHLSMLERLEKKLPGLSKQGKNFFNEYDKFLDYVERIRDGESDPLILVENDNIFEAVYSTNALMRVADLLITKPSELVFYPIPKVFQRHIGGHEVYGGIYGKELGDAMEECPDKKSMDAMLDSLLNDSKLYLSMVDRILELKKEGVYNGAYEAVKAAVKGRD